MSIDLQIWSVSEPSWPEMLPDFGRWQPALGGMILQKRNWQIVVGPVSRVLSEDIPDEIMEKLPGIQYLIELNLEPGQAPSSAERLLRRVASNIGQAGPGIILDPQEGTLTTPRGVKRFQRQAQTARISLLTFSWWFREGPLLGTAGIRELLSLLERFLPEAMPRRYGEYEPPQFQFSEMGPVHFVDRVARTKSSLVWYPHYPVLSVYPGLFADSGPTRQGYRANYLSVGIDSSVLEQPGWQLGLERFWREMSRFVRPFYGDVRRLDQYLFRRGRIFIDQQTEQHPVMNGWWNGVPYRLGGAVVLGEPYATHWPAFVNHAQADRGLNFLSVNGWPVGAGVEELLGGVPAGLAQGSYPDLLKGITKRTYPRIWPFEYPFKSD